MVENVFFTAKNANFQMRAKTATVEQMQPNLAHLIYSTGTTNAIKHKSLALSWPELWVFKVAEATGGRNPLKKCSFPKIVKVEVVALVISFILI